MYAYKIKELAKRGTALLGAAGMLAGIGTTAIPVLVSADALNPLTERSLTLSSSSPGWSYLDGSGNTKYAPPNSGANGQKTGNTFTFRMSSTGKTVKGITFQYCTTPAGACTAPGDGTSAGHADLDIINNGTQRTLTGAEYTSVLGQPDKTPNPDGSEGNFVALYGASSGGSAGIGYAANSDQWVWEDASNVESPAPVTGKHNFMAITNAGGQLISGTSGDYFKIIFYGTDDNYITNPGSGSFFVRINTYDTDNTADFDAAHAIDGGVTVANVMNESITIQTKVLETMDFSVGVFDPNTLTLPVAGGSNAATNDPDLADPGAIHVQCAPLLMKDPTQSPADYASLGNNVLRMGDPAAEYSLKTTADYDTHSYWRLSSNSSGGATVYYTGHTLTNTVDDQITPLSDNPSSDASTKSIFGTEQFGLGLDVDNSNTAVRAVASDTYGSSNGNPSTSNGTFADYVADTNNAVKAHLPGLAPLVPTPSYGNAAGTLGSNGTKFAFNANADTYAIPLASENTDVVNCVTAKMRYVANIAATTPAGVYTTKVNYVASPQY